MSSFCNFTYQLFGYLHINGRYDRLAKAHPLKALELGSTIAMPGNELAIYALVRRMVCTYYRVTAPSMRRFCAQSWLN